MPIVSPVKHPNKLFIGGDWVSPSSDGKIEVVSPTTEEVVFTVAEARELLARFGVSRSRDGFFEKNEVALRAS